MSEKTKPIPPLTEKNLRNFWKKVNGTRGLGPGGDCWQWTASRVKGYGQFRIGGGMYLAHRVAWFFKNGPIPAGMFVLHHCDNSACVNPDHLWLGTNADNMRDMKKKGRGATGKTNGAYTRPDRVRRGEGNGRAKLTASKVSEIRKRYAAGGCTYQGIAIEYEVSDTMIGAVINRENWTHI